MTINLTKTADSDLIDVYAAHGFTVGDRPPRRDLGPDKIDLTPNYADVVPILIAALQNGTPEGQKLARQELLRMARIADLYNLIASKDRA